MVTRHEWVDAAYEPDVERAALLPDAADEQIGTGDLENPVWAITAMSGSNGIAIYGTRYELLTWLDKARRQVESLPDRY